MRSDMRDFKIGYTKCFFCKEEKKCIIFPSGVAVCKDCLIDLTKEIR